MLNPLWEQGSIYLPICQSPQHPAGVHAVVKNSPAFNEELKIQKAG
jgi:hypothetical protein